MKPLSKITVSVFPAPHIFEINVAENGERILSGVEGRFLNSIMTALGLPFDMLEPVDHEWGRQISKNNWTGLIGMVASGKADMAIGTLSITEARMEVVDFSSSYALEETTFALKKIAWKPIMAYLSYPFDLSVWICLVGIILLLSVTVLFIFGKKKRSFGDIILQLLSSVLRQPLQLKNEMEFSKILFSFWLFFALVISLSYSAALFSFLAVPIQEVPIENFRQLSQAVQTGSHQCFVLKGSSTISFLLRSDEAHLVKLGEMMEFNKWYYNISQMIKGSHISDRIVQIQSQMAFDLFYGAPDFKENILVSRDHLAVWPMAIAVSKNFCCKSKLNRILSRLKSSGLYMKYLRDESVKILLDVTRETNMINENRQLNLDDVSGAILLLFFGYFASIVALFGEIVYFHLHLKGKKR